MVTTSELEASCDDFTVHHDEYGVGTFVLALTLGLICKTHLSGMLKLPYTVLLLLLGFFFGLAHFEYQGVEDWCQGIGFSMKNWIEIPPESLLYTFLPVLIFESAFSTDVHIFHRELGQVLLLAVPGVILATILTALVAKYLFPYGWEWSLALLFGAMMSATDPVAVVALLKELGVSSKLGTLIEGESLLNDGTAYVIFLVFLHDYAGEEEATPATVAETAARLALGGPLVGAVLGWVGSFLVGFILNDPLSEITLTLVVCMSAFVLTEGTVVHVSGILAVVLAGLVFSYLGKGRISASVEHSLHGFWQMLGHVANTVIFFISGLIVASSIESNVIEGRDWGLLIMLYVFLVLIRMLNLTLCAPLLGRGSEYGVGWRQLLVVGWGGLRGAVGLVLALVVLEHAEELDAGSSSHRLLTSTDTETTTGHDHNHTEDAERVFFHMAGVAFLTLVVNGSSTGALIHALGLDRASRAETRLFVRACSALEAETERVVARLAQNPLAASADFEQAWRYLPVPTAKVYWHRMATGHVKLCDQELQEIRTNWDETTVAHKVWRWLLHKLLPESVLSRGWEVRVPARLRRTWKKYHKAFRLDQDDHQRVLKLSSASSTYVVDLPHDETAAPPRRGIVRSPFLKDILSTDFSAEEAHPFLDLTGVKLQVAAAEAAAAEFAAAEAEKEAAAAAAAAAPKGKGFFDFGAAVAEAEADAEAEAPAAAAAEAPGSSPAAEGGGGEELVARRAALQRELAAVEDELIQERLREASSVSLAVAQEVGSAASGIGALVAQVRHNEMLDHMTLGNHDQLRKSRKDGTEQQLPRLRSTSLGEEGFDKETLEKCREGVLRAYRTEFEALFEEGWVGSTALRISGDAVDDQLDETALPLSLWRRMARASHLTNHSLSRLAKWRNNPLLRPLVERYIAYRYGHLFELGATFLAATHHVLEAFRAGEAASTLGPDAETIVRELEEDQKQAQKMLEGPLSVFKEIAAAVCTRAATRYLLVKQRELVREYAEHGHLTGKEADFLMRGLDRARVKLQYHPVADTWASQKDLVGQLPFLQGLPAARRQELLGDTEVCEVEFHGEGFTLAEAGRGTATRGGFAEAPGFYVVIRGSVLMKRPGMPEQALTPGTIFGYTEQLLGLPYTGTYRTASFCQVLFVHSQGLAREAERDGTLQKGVWHALACSALHHFGRYPGIPPQDLYELMLNALFVRIDHTFQLNKNQDSEEGKGTEEDMSTSKKSNASSKLSMSSKRSKKKSEEENLFPKLKDDAPWCKYNMGGGSMLLLLKGKMKGLNGTPLEGKLWGPVALIQANVEDSFEVEFQEGAVAFELGPPLRAALDREAAAAAAAFQSQGGSVQADHATLKLKSQTLLGKELGEKGKGRRNLAGLVGPRRLGSGPPPPRRPSNRPAPAPQGTIRQKEQNLSFSF